METKNVLAFDLGASSGRGILARFDGKKIRLSEISRFANNFSMFNGHARWDVLYLTDEMKKAIAGCKEHIESIGFDTWGVDFGLLDAQGNLLGFPFSYRDNAFDEKNMDQALSLIGGKKEAFAQTGVASLTYNTVYQLYYIQKHMPALYGAADKVLLLPNLFEYLFSGVMHTEYAIASTTQLYDMKNRVWADALMQRLSLHPDQFTPVEFAGRDLGPLRGDIAKQVGKKDLHVVSAPGHDTACAVAAVPTKEKEFLFLSCGTWSLLGVASPHMLTGENIITEQISNEGTADGGYRPTKNIIGLWIIQQLRRNFAERGKTYSFQQMQDKARWAKPFRCFIRPEDFMLPDDYPKKIRAYCESSGQPVPETDGELIRCVLESLALTYRRVLDGLRPMIFSPEKLYMVGGGVNNTVLCQFTANALGIPVIAGAGEATAAGNVMTQLKAIGAYQTEEEKREILLASFDTKTYEPQDTDAWTEAYEKFLRLTNEQ